MIKNVFINKCKKQKNTILFSELIGENGKTYFNRSGVINQIKKHMIVDCNKDIEERNKILNKQLNSFPLANIEILKSNIVDGKTMRQISAETNISLNHVFNYCKKAKMLIKKDFNKYYHHFNQ